MLPQSDDSKERFVPFFNFYLPLPQRSTKPLANKQDEDDSIHHGYDDAAGRCIGRHA